MKLIAVDVDGTLLNSQRVISDKTRDALIAAGEAGHKIVIVSGRPTAAVYHLAKELKFDEFGGLLSNFNGGSITNYATGEVISNHTLDIDLAKELLALTHEIDIEFVMPRGDRIVSNKDSKYLGVEKTILGLEADVVEDLVDSIDFAPNKIVFANDPEILEEQMPIIKERFADRTSQVRSQRFYYEIMPVGLSKGASLLEIADHYGIEKADIIAFGDEMNDYTMIEVAGVGVAMGNAVEPIKEIADHVTLSNDEDGIAAYLEEFVL